MNRRILAIFLTSALLACSQGKSEKKKSSETDPGPAPTNDAGTDSDTATDSGTDTDTAKDTGAGKGTPILAFFGGYTSCGTGDSGDPLKQDLATFFKATLVAMKKKLGSEPKSIISCYTLAYESVLYRVSGEEGVQDKLIAGMEADFEDLLGSVDNPEVLMVGHSYGGWTAMDTALKMAPGVKLKGLVTLDPISHVECRTDDVISAAFNPVPGCTRPPQDFGDDKIKILADTAGEWLNFYQGDLNFLHSGEIKGAKNTKRQYGGTGFAPHNGFLSDDAIGEEILTLAEHSF